MELPETRLVGILLHDVDLLLVIFVLVNVVKVLAHLLVAIDDELLFEGRIELACESQLCYALLLLSHMKHQEEPILNTQGSASRELSHCSAVHVLSMLKEKLVHLGLERLLRALVAALLS